MSNIINQEDQDDESSEVRERKIASRLKKIEKYFDLLQDCRGLNFAHKLGAYLVDESIYDFYLCKSLKDHERYKPVSLDNYVSSFCFLLEVEFVYSELDLRRYDMENAEVHNNRVAIHNICQYDVPLIPYVHYLIIKPALGGEHRLCQITRVEENEIHFYIEDQYPTYYKSKKFRPLLDDGEYSIRFICSGLMWQRLTKAVKSLREDLKLSIFNSDLSKFEIGLYESKIDITKTSTEWLEQRLASLSERQQVAIKRILEAKCRPAPYVLLTPPGTDKLTTLVELIVQIYHRDRGSTILLTGRSNETTDKMAEQLCATGQINSICRLASTSSLCARERHATKEAPSYAATEDPFKAITQRIVVTTNSMTGAKRLDGVLFDYVLMNKADHASEPEVIMSMNRCRPDGCIVLAGDPEQLGPVVRCRQAGQLGLDKSLVARLVQEVDRYKRNKNGIFDERYITCLVENNRSDSRIMHLSNELFYRNELRCNTTRTPPSLLAILRVQSPVLFLNVAHGPGPCQSSSGSLLFNQEEIDAVIEQIIQLYTMGLEPHQIGVVTLNRLHKEKLNEALEERLMKASSTLDSMFPQSAQQELGDNNNNGSDECLGDKANRTDNWRCKIDTIDGFRCGEREVIIISLAIAPDEKDIAEGELQFVDDPKRFNVCITRARWLNIVVGHEHVMRNLPVWTNYMSKAQQISSNAEKCLKTRINENNSRLNNLVKSDGSRSELVYEPGQYNPLVKGGRRVYSKQFMMTVLREFLEDLQE